MDKHSSPTIGVLVGWHVYTGGLHSFLAPMLHGIRVVARANGCRLVLACGVGNTIEGVFSPIHPAWPIPAPDSDFVPVGPWNTDGLVVVTPLLSASRARDVQDFIAAGHPVVFSGAGEQGPAVIPDNEDGVRQAIAHLVAHGHRRIAFIAGYETGPSGDSSYRLAAYWSAVRQYGLDADESLVAYGWHTPSGGHQAMLQILASGGPFTAVLASNDESASGAMRALRGVGLRIPQDVAIIGIDDRFEAMAQVPPLASVRYSAFEMGGQAVLLLLDYVEGRKKGAETVRIPMRLIPRQSCGCQPGLLRQSNPVAAQSPIDLSPDGNEEEARLALAVTAAILDELDRLSAEEVYALCKRLARAFYASVEGGDSGDFIATLESILRQVEAADDDPHVWQDAISVLASVAHESVAGQETGVYQRLEETLRQARIVISESVRRQYRQYVLHQSRVANQIGLLTARLLTALDERQVFQALSECLPELDIWRAHIVFYEPEGDDPVGRSVMRMVAAEAEPLCFPTRSFPPAGMDVANEPFSLVLLPLVVREGRTGFVAFETQDLESCAAIVRQLASVYERQLVEEALAKERNLLRTLIDTLPDNIFVKDTASRIVLDNLAHRRLVGAESLEDVVGKTDRDFFASELAEQYYVDEQEVIRSGLPLANREEPTVDKGGKERWLLTSKVPLRDSHGVVTGLVGINRDITMRKWAEQALQRAHEEVERSRRYLRAVLDSVDHAMVVTDLEGHVRLANRATETLLGIAEADAIGRPLVKVIGHETLQNVADRIAKGEILQPEALQVELSDGCALVAHVAPVIGSREELVGYVIAMADVTALHELSQLKSRLINVASHDLRNPLHLAGGFFQILLEDIAPLTKPQDELARRVRNNLDKMERLIDELLELERVEGTEVEQQEVLDVREIVRDVMHDQRLPADLKRQRLWSHVADDLPRVGGDRRLLTQALTNLVDNAIKYTPEEGEIIVRSWETNGEVVITVQDNGVGIPIEFQPHVFDRFYRARQPGTEHISGSGLGLSLVRGIVRQHKGRVWVESAGQAGQGATFGLALPVLHAEEVGKKVDG